MRLALVTPLSLQRWTLVIMGTEQGHGHHHSCSHTQGALEEGTGFPSTVGCREAERQLPGPWCGWSSMEMRRLFIHHSPPEWVSGWRDYSPFCVPAWESCPAKCHRSKCLMIVSGKQALPGPTGHLSPRGPLHHSCSSVPTSHTPSETPGGDLPAAMGQAGTACHLLPGDSLP